MLNFNITCFNNVCGMKKACGFLVPVFGRYARVIVGLHMCIREICLFFL